MCPAGSHTHSNEREEEGKKDERKMLCDDKRDVWKCFVVELKDGGGGHESRNAALEADTGKGTFFSPKSTGIAEHCWHLGSSPMEHTVDGWPPDL